MMINANRNQVQSRARVAGAGHAGWLCLPADLCADGVASKISTTPKRLAGGLSQGGIPFF